MSMQYHLTGKGFSGRAVRLRELDPSEVEANQVATAKLSGENTSLMEFKKIEWRNGAKLMVQEFSEPCADPLAEGVKWKKVTPGLLENLGEYFKAKDVGVLEHIYRDYHEVVPSEINAIVGKAVPVSEG